MEAPHFAGVGLAHPTIDALVLQLPDIEGEMECIYEKRYIRRDQDGANEMTQWVKAGFYLTTWV